MTNLERLERCIGSLESMRDYSDPYEVDADELDYAANMLKILLRSAQYINGLIPREDSEQDG